MSKLDAMRALREAKYAARQAPDDRSGRAAVARRAPVAPALSADVESTAERATGDRACGHRSMNGRTCTREAGHAEKSHRYG